MTITAKIASPDRKAIFDFVKYVLALMVVAIHSNLFPLVLYPWLRLAVPLFFMLSSYFFFGGLRKCTTADEKKLRWRKYVKRNLILYFFWFVALLPYTLYVRHYFDEGTLNGILKFIKSLFCGSTFPASWFIQALIVSVTIVFWASKRIGDRCLLALSFLLYCFAIIRSSYWNIIEEKPFLNSIYGGFELILSSPVFNATSAFVWVMFGKILAEKQIRLKKQYVIVGGGVSAVLLYCEWLFIKALNGSFNNDCYFFLMPSAFFLFQFVSQIQLPANKITNFMGKCSILIYTTHVPAIALIGTMLERFFSSAEQLVVFLTVACLCTLGSYIVLKIENFGAFKWLRYSH